MTKSWIKKGLLYFITIGSVATLSAPASAATIVGNASAVINAKITISENTAMDFAKIAVDSSSQTVALSNSGTVTCPSQYECTGTAANGAFAITSTSGQTLNVTYTNGTLTGPGAAMAINVNGISAANTSTLVSTGTDSLAVGGELVVGENQTPGSYSGTYVVSVNY